MSDEGKKKDVAGVILPVEVDQNITVQAEAEKLRLSIEVVKAQLASQIEFMLMRAQMHRAYYDELIRLGFTPEQALELVKVKGL